MNVYQQLLKEAYDRIYNDEDVFVCCAVDHAARKLNLQVTGIKSWISSDLLGGAYTLDHWLENKGYIPKVNGVYGSYAYRNKIKKTRLAWIKWMMKNLPKSFN